MLKGKVALVTGSTSGIGLAIARTFAQDGANIVINGFGDKDAIEKERSGIEKDFGVKAIYSGADMSKGDQIAAMIADAEKQLGSIDILVNNAGITRDNLFMRMKDDEWDQVIAVNLTAAFRLSRAVLRGMMKKRWGRIVQITSVVGATGNPGQGNYAAAKAGLVGMTKSLAAEVASRNITVNAVAPGFIQTAMTDVLTDQQKETISTRIPAGRMGLPEEIAAAVVYLASPEAAYVTGETIQINGGMAML
jgi:3-oxoacyl-[acyl-carrier protein] reductase